MATRPRRNRVVIKYILLIIPIILMVTYIYPFIHLALISFGANYNKVPPEFIPSVPTLRGYLELFAHPLLSRWVLNSVIFAVGTTFGSIALAILAGYALSRIQFPGRTIVFWYSMLGIMIPGIMLYIPLYILMLRAKLLNTYQGLIIPLLASAYNVFLVKQAFDAIPRDFEEAAYIDGAGSFTIAFRIMMPLVKPVIVTALLYNFVWNWNNFAWPLFVAPNSERYTLALGVWMSTWSYTVDFWKYASGAILQAAVPIVLYVLALSYFLRGLKMAGLKK
ncbi:MAG: carbohydrate ABC transporter permease [Desulfurococcaceae archaeon]